MNYRDWVSRAVSFTAELNKLPGEITVTCQTAPSLTEHEVAKLRERWNRHLPAELVRLWTDGSSHLDCHYVWTPPPAELPELHKIFEYNNYIYGGPRFIPAAEVDPERIDTSEFDGDILDGAPEDAEKTKVLWGRAIIVLHIANGDCLGLDPEAPGCDPDDPPVVYLVHDAASSAQIAPGFTDFLNQWERLSYIGPESWLLDYWLDPDAGRISADRYMTKELRRLLCPR